MNPPDDGQLEQLLRAAPAPPPPRGLQALLENDLPRQSAAVVVRGRRRPGWWGSWWPVLATACLALGCFVMAGVQSARLTELRRSLEELRAKPAAAADVSAAPAPARDPRAEIVELRSRLATLEAELAAASAPAQAAGAPAAPVDAAEEAAFREAAEKLAAARERAHSIQCVNNLKQLGLAARVWATDNGDVLPSTWLQMTNEMATPKILVCPADLTRSAAADWGSFGPANVSYDFVTPQAPETEPQVVLFRCPIHGHVCLADGSVQHGVAKTHPEWFQMVNGRLTMTGGSTPAPAPVPAGAQAQTPVRMSPELMRRYGLVPSTNNSVTIGSGEVPGTGTFEVVLEGTEFVPEGEAPPEQP